MQATETIRFSKQPATEGPSPVQGTALVAAGGSGNVTE